MQTIFLQFSGELKNAYNFLNTKQENLLLTKAIKWEYVCFQETEDGEKRVWVLSSN